MLPNCLSSPVLRLLVRLSDASAILCFSLVTRLDPTGGAVYPSISITVGTEDLQSLIALAATYTYTTARRALKYYQSSEVALQGCD